MNKAQEMKQKVQDLKNIRRHFLRQKDQCAALVVGHYCHDQIILQGGEIVYSLGGGGGLDLSSPMCFKHSVWNLGKGNLEFV